MIKSKTISVLILLFLLQLNSKIFAQKLPSKTAPFTTQQQLQKEKAFLRLIQQKWKSKEDSKAYYFNKNNTVSVDGVNCEYTINLNAKTILITKNKKEWLLIKVLEIANDENTLVTEITKNKKIKTTTLIKL